MRFLRALAPFLFVRNWYTGEWELSSHRILIFVGLLTLFSVACGIIIYLQAPVEYSASSI